MAAYVYPAVFKLCENDCVPYYVRFPDLDDSGTQGYTLDEAICMAGDLLRILAEEALSAGKELPQPSALKDVPVEEDEFASLIRAEPHNTKAVRKTVSLPQWMAERADAEHISLSKVLQSALEERLNP